MLSRTFAIWRIPPHSDFSCPFYHRIAFILLSSGINLFLKIKAAIMEVIQILRRKRECFADGGTNAIYPAALALGVICEARSAAFTASDASSAPFSSPFLYLLILQVPDDPSPNPSIQHKKTR
jgi:hypothetical protein